MKLFSTKLSGRVAPLAFPDNGVRIFLINGQSNSVGYADNIDMDPSEEVPYDHFKIWNGNAFVSLEIGVNNKASGVDYHGVELGLALNLQSYFPDDTFYLVKDGKGGRPIAYFSPNGDEVRLYYNTRKVLRDALNNLIASGKIPYVYMLWHQGENDAQYGYTTYEDELRELFNLWDNTYAYDTPKVIPSLLLNSPNTGRVAVNAIFETVVSESSNLAISASSYLDEKDSSHWSYQGFKDMSILHLDNLVGFEPRVYNFGVIVAEMNFYTTSTSASFSPSIVNSGSVNWVLIQDDKDALKSSLSLPTFNLSGNTDRGCLITIQSDNSGLSNIVEIDLASSSITSYDIREAIGLVNVDLSDNLLTDFYLDDLLSKLNSAGKSNGSIKIINNSGSLTVGAQSDYDSLISKGWTIDVGRP